MGLNIATGDPFYAASGYPSRARFPARVMSAEEFAAADLWNSPCAPPDEPDVYAVMTGQDIYFRTTWEDRYTPADKFERQEEQRVRYAHWNGHRWSDVRRDPRDFTGQVWSDPRRFNPRQDYPWRQIQEAA